MKRRKSSSCELFLGGHTSFGRSVSKMSVKTVVASMGLGAAAGAVAVLMMPRSNPTRRLAAKAANKVEDVAWKVSDKLSQELDL